MDEFRQQATDLLAGMSEEQIPVDGFGNNLAEESA
jgi:hypothetical protein